MCLLRSKLYDTTMATICPHIHIKADKGFSLTRYHHTTHTVLHCIGRGGGRRVYFCALSRVNYDNNYVESKVLSGTQYPKYKCLQIPVTPPPLPASNLAPGRARVPSSASLTHGKAYTPTGSIKVHIAARCPMIWEHGPSTSSPPLRVMVPALSLAPSLADVVGTTCTRA